MDIKDVENLAELARIELSQEEKESLLTDMEGILEYVKQVESVKVPEVHPEQLLYNVFREDQPFDREFDREAIINQFPDKQDNYLKVKKIL